MMDITVYLPDEIGQWAKDAGLNLSQMLRAEVEAARQRRTAASIDVETVKVDYFRPTVTMLDGTTIVCEHKYRHENRKAAETCGRKIAANGAFVK
jgi:post-segregation antitoxin (ccd killing protein)